MQIKKQIGDVAQVVRAHGSYPCCHWFESSRRHHRKDALQYSYMISKKRFIFPILFITGVLCLSFLLFSQWLPEFYWFESFQAQNLWIQIFSYKAKTFLAFFALAYFILRSQVAIARHLSKKAKNDPFPYLLSKPLELIAE